MVGGLLVGLCGSALQLHVRYRAAACVAAWRNSRQGLTDACSMVCVLHTIDFCACMHRTHDRVYSVGHCKHAGGAAAACID
jgi:hypothetical protein